MTSQGWGFLDNSTLPKQLFKYRPINDFTEKIFTKQELYFASPKDFNDPFECAFQRRLKRLRKQPRRFRMNIMKKLLANSLRA